MKADDSFYIKERVEIILLMAVMIALVQRIMKHKGG